MHRAQSPVAHEMKRDFGMAGIFWILDMDL